VTAIAEFVKGKADFSTTVHEAAHAWYEALVELPETRDLMLKHYGDPADFTKAGIQGKEKWARHVEKFLWDGKAPSPETQGLFEASRDWMLQTYARWRHGKPDAEVQAMLNERFKTMSPESIQILKQMDVLADAKLHYQDGPYMSNAHLAGIISSAKNEFTDQERKMLGLDVAARGAATSKIEAYMEAKRQGITAASVMEKVNRQISRGDSITALTPEENIMLAYGKAKVLSDIKSVSTKIQTLTDEDMILSARKEVDLLRGKYDELSKVAALAGTASGQSLASRAWLTEPLWDFDGVRLEIEALRGSAMPRKQVDALKKHFFDKDNADEAFKVAREKFDAAKEAGDVEAGKAALDEMYQHEIAGNIAKLQIEAMRNSAKYHDLSKNWHIWTVKLMRNNILSGTSILMKLGAVTAQHVLTDAGAGLVLRLPQRVVQRVVGGNSKGLTEGVGLKTQFRSEMEGLREGLSVDALKDVFKKAKTGVNSLDAKGGFGDKNDAPNLLNFFERVHGAIKTPLQRYEFQKTYRRTLDQVSEARGWDTPEKQQMGLMENPRLAEGILDEAYSRSLEAILMNSSEAANKWGAVSAAGPDSGTMAKLWYVAANTLAPIKRITFNYAGRAAEMQAGLVIAPAKLAYQKAYRMRHQGEKVPIPKADAQSRQRLADKGLGPERMVVEAMKKELSPQEWEEFWKVFKRGSAGAALMYLGYTGKAGVDAEGYYDGSNQDTAGKISIFGYEIPKAMAHGPLFEPIMIGATMRKWADRDEDDSFTKVRRQAWAATKGYLENAALVNASQSLARLMRGGETMEKEMGKYASNLVVPYSQLSSEIAMTLAKGPVEGYIKRGDKRSPEGFLDEIKMKIPRLREQVPEK
jgi:hypothetical protein